MIKSLLLMAAPSAHVEESAENFTMYNSFKMRSINPQFATDAIHVGQEPSRWNSRAVTVPISLCTTFEQVFPVQPDSFNYSRCGNPTRQALEECIACLEKGKYAYTFASGITAVSAICHLLRSGDHVVCMSGLYSGSYCYFTDVLPGFGITTTFCDMRDLDNVEKALQENTKLIWIETPTNPQMKIVDIQEVSRVSHSYNQEIIVATDNTFMSPYFQNPLLLGSDVVMHSLTKYMNGHSDVLMGAVITSEERIAVKLKFIQSSVGIVPSPFDCYMVLRGLKTLHLRMREHMKNGLAVAEFLESHPCVSQVLYPGLQSHPQHDLALKQSHGFSGMLSFFMKGTIEEGKHFLKSLEVFVAATSLGGCDSLAGIPLLMNQAPTPPSESPLSDELQVSHCAIDCGDDTDVLVRLSVGIEDTHKLIQDLDQALLKACHFK